MVWLAVSGNVGLGDLNGGHKVSVPKSGALGSAKRLECSISGGLNCLLPGGLADMAGFDVGQKVSAPKESSVGPSRKLAILESRRPGKAGWLAGPAGWPDS